MRELVGGERTPEEKGDSKSLFLATREGKTPQGGWERYLPPTEGPDPLGQYPAG